MICLRCGYCCKQCMVVIVDDPEKGPVEDNLIAIDCHEEGQCKHLRGDKPGEYSCVLHDKPWYEETPCFMHGQEEDNPNTPCRIGEAIMKNH